MLASWLKTWWPDACRAVRNTYPDPGDIDCTSPGLFWSVKYCQVETVGSWVREMMSKVSLNQTGLLVTRRKGYSCPAEWWVHVRICDYLHLCGADALWDRMTCPANATLRMELRNLMPLLVETYFAPVPK